MTEFRPRNRRVLMGSVVDTQTIAGDFRDGLTYNSTFTNVTFENARLDRIQWFGSKFHACRFLNCTMNQVNLNSTQFHSVRFEGCEMDQATFEASRFDMCAIRGGRAEYVSFKDATVRATEFDTNLHGANLCFADSKNVDFGNSNLWGAVIPLSCRFFVGNHFSDRQFALFLGLAARSKGRREFENLLDSKWRAIIERLVIDDDAKEA